MQAGIRRPHNIWPGDKDTGGINDKSGRHKAKPRWVQNVVSALA